MSRRVYLLRNKKEKITKNNGLTSLKRTSSASSSVSSAEKLKEKKEFNNQMTHLDSLDKQIWVQYWYNNFAVHGSTGQYAAS